MYFVHILKININLTIFHKIDRYFFTTNRNIFMCVLCTLNSFKNKNHTIAIIYKHTYKIYYFSFSLIFVLGTESRTLCPLSFITELYF